MKEHRFQLKGEWEGGRGGVGAIDVGGLKTDVSLTESMNGKGIGTNPDEMLVGSVTTCYMMTLGIRLASNNIQYKKMTVDSEGVVIEDEGLRFDRIVHYPTIVLAEDTDAKTIDTVTDLAYEAEMHCMIGNALRGNVDIQVEPKVITEQG